MSVNEERLHLVQTEASGAKVALEPGPSNPHPILTGITAMASVSLNLLGAMFGFDNRSMEEWARTEHVSWYEGCSR